MMKRTAGSLVVLLISACTAVAQDAQRSDDQRAVQSTIENYVQAFNAQDVEKLSSFWTESGDYMDLKGRLITGRENIETEYDSFFNAFGKPMLTISLVSLHFANETTAIEDGLREIQFPDNQPTREMRYTAIHVKQGGQWLLQSVRDAVVYDDPTSENLRQLEWMVGEWLDEDQGGAAIQTSCNWSPSGKFLIRDFTTMLNGEETIGGTQWIGWNPVTETVHSWLFDSDGGYGDAEWVSDGDKWIIRSKSVRPSGKLVEETHVMTFVDQDRMSLETTDRTLDGQPLPDVKEIVARREGTSVTDAPPAIRKSGL